MCVIPHPCRCATPVHCTCATPVQVCHPCAHVPPPVHCTRATPVQLCHPCALHLCIPRCRCAPVHCTCVTAVQMRHSRALHICCKLELVVGSPASCMDLELYSADERLLGRLDRDEALLGSYPVDDGCRVHVIDRSGARLGQFEDVSQVPKYEMPESEYDKRPESLRSFLQRRQLGRYAEAEDRRRRRCDGDGDGDERALAARIPLGSRCRVRVPGQPAKRGTVMYVDWGRRMRLLEPPGSFPLGTASAPGASGASFPLSGATAGLFRSVNGRKYFECQPKYGAFVKPPSVTVGDFPEEDDGLEDEM
uniref:Tubulin folding cofactor B n=1 Tax=Apteryx owenii TaxID=8824 RepID=A0A8B9QQ30_APTOW